MPKRRNTIVTHNDLPFTGVSQSKVKTWRQCRFAYHNKYVLGLIRRKVKRPFMFGRMIHEMIEAHANADDPFEVLDRINLENANMFAAEREMYGDIVNDVRTIMTNYFSYWGEDSIRYIRKGGKAAEHEFKIEVDGIPVKGKIDAFGKAKKLKWLVEHKSFKRKPNEDTRWRNVQSSVYMRIADMLGWPSLDGTLWDYVRSAPPPKPELLKNGELSRKKIVTFPSVYAAAVEEHGLNLSDYGEFIDDLIENMPNYFFRVFTPTSRDVIDIVFDDFMKTAREIADLHGKSHVRNIGQHCDFCDYEPICRAALQGSDVDFVKEREYVRDEGETEPPVEEVD